MPEPANEVGEIRRFLEYQHAEKPVFVEVDGQGFLVRSVSDEEVGIVFRLHPIAWYRVTSPVGDQ